MALTTTDPSQLANAARCFDSCIPKNMQAAVQNYLLATLAGLDTSPAGVAVILNNARCFTMCIPDGDQPAVQSYLLTQLVS